MAHTPSSSSSPRAASRPEKQANSGGLKVDAKNTDAPKFAIQYIHTVAIMCCPNIQLCLMESIVQPISNTKMFSDTNIYTVLHTPIMCPDICILV